MAHKGSKQVFVPGPNGLPERLTSLNKRLEKQYQHKLLFDKDFLKQNPELGEEATTLRAKLFKVAKKT